MSTSSNSNRPPREPQPRMSLLEAITGSSSMIVLFVSGPVGFYSHMWSEKIAALISIGAIMIGFMAWGIVHRLLVASGRVAPIDFVAAQAASRSGGR